MVADENNFISLKVVVAVREERSLEGKTAVEDDLNLVSCPFKNDDGHLIEF